MKRAAIFAMMLSAIATTARGAEPDYSVQAAQVMNSIQKVFYIPAEGLYRREVGKSDPDFMWGNGVMFSALVGAARYQPDVYEPLMARFFSSMDRYWDARAPIPGYEPAPTRGNGNDKYYDDNQWMVLTFTEAYQITHEQKYLLRAEAALKFSLSGWDERLGGGIVWHEPRKDQSKNTCSNAPAATACVRIARFLPVDESRKALVMAGKIVDWTNSRFEASDGLYKDSETIADHKVNAAKLTYNTALMIRAELGLYRWTGEEKYLSAARRSARAADWFLDKKNGAYRDSIKWSHLQVEADLEMYRVTHEDYLLQRARSNAAFYFEKWQKQAPETLIDNASIARMLWLMADVQSPVGKKFWETADRVPGAH